MREELIIDRNYDVADVTSLPSALKTLIELFGSEPMFTILGSLTGLTSDNDEEEETSYEPSPKKQKSTPVGRISLLYFFSPFFSHLAQAASSSNSSAASSPRWYFELRRWKHSYYSLSYDTDNTANANDDDDEDEDTNGTLDVMIFFNYQPVDEAEEAVGGGDVVYTIKNEDETVICLSSN